MIRCNGSCSGRRATPAKKTPAGEIDPSAQRVRACSGVFAKLAAKSTTKPSFDCERSPNFIATGSRSDGPSKSDRI
jgi:hypothetical protein